MELACENPVLLSLCSEHSDAAAFTVRGPVRTLTVHAAQVYCLAPEMALLAAHVARLGSHAFSGSVSKSSEFKAPTGVRHSSNGDTTIAPPNNTLSDFSSFSAFSFVATLTTTGACWPLGLGLPSYDATNASNMTR